MFEPLSPSAPFGPCGPAGPRSPAGPAGPSAPAGPAGPAGPSAPAAPAGPAGPSAPAGPAGRLRPWMPADRQADLTLGPTSPWMPCRPVRPICTLWADFALDALQTGQADLTLWADFALDALQTGQADLTLRADFALRAVEADQALDALQTHEATLALQALSAGGADQARDAADRPAFRPALPDDAEAHVGLVEPADLDVVEGDSVTLGLDPETRSRDRAGLALSVRCPCCGAYDHHHQAEHTHQRDPSLERHNPFPVSTAWPIRAGDATVGPPGGRTNDPNESTGATIVSRVRLRRPRW